MFVLSAARPGEPQSFPSTDGKRAFTPTQRPWGFYDSQLTASEVAGLHSPSMGGGGGTTTASIGPVVLSSQVYRPFGEIEPIITGQDPEETIGYIGERFDSDAGLQYLNARYYDPASGMFIQPDWFEVTEPGVGTNRYGYSFNDPVNLRDPSGNSALAEWLVAAAGVAVDSMVFGDEFNIAAIVEQRRENQQAFADFVLPDFEELFNDDLNFRDVMEVIGIVPAVRLADRGIDGLRMVGRSARNRVDPAEVGGISGIRPHPDGPAAGGRKPQYQGDGGLDQARSDFETAVGGEFTELPNGNLRGTGPNGENIIFNPQSAGGLNPNATGSPTIYISGSAIRYD